METTDVGNSGADWIRQANARFIGQTEFRQVKLQIGSGLGTRTLRIRTLRKIEKSVSQTVFCVMEPQALSNINYVVTEHRGQMDPFDIQLYLPYVFGTLRKIPSTKRGEGLLGSDFTYDDFRTWQYEQGHRYENPVINDDEVMVAGICVENPHLVRHGTAPFVIRLHAESGFVRGIDYYAADRSCLVRKYRADEVTKIKGVEIARRMTMQDYKLNHVTTVLLERAWYDQAVDPKVFDSSFRKHTRDYLASL